MRVKYKAVETLIVKFETMQLLEKNIEDNLWGLGLGKKILDLTKSTIHKKKNW